MAWKSSVIAELSAGRRGCFMRRAALQAGRVPEKPMCYMLGTPDKDF